MKSQDQEEQKSAERIAFNIYLRTGRYPCILPQDLTSRSIEHKFNPYHDPRDGRFTFAPGGPRSLSNVIISDRRKTVSASGTQRPQIGTGSLNVTGVNADNRDRTPSSVDAVYRPASSMASLERIGYRRSRGRRGDNAGAFYDPVTLQQIFPGLRGSAPGTIIALADNALDISGPANQLTAQMTLEYSARLIEDIQSIAPNYRFQSLGFPSTLEGQIKQINRLRVERAVLAYKIRGEVRPLQVEMLRFLQRKTDQSYDTAKERLKTGRLRIHISENETIGNFIDAQVRDELRDFYRTVGIDVSRNQKIRVNARAYATSETERTYRIPDSWIDSIAYDVTLSPKTAEFNQIRGFFKADMKPQSVIIVRPSQIGPNNTYIITRPKD